MKSLLFKVAVLAAFVVLLSSPGFCAEGDTSHEAWVARKSRDKLYTTTEEVIASPAGKEDKEIGRLDIMNSNGGRFLPEEDVSVGDPGNNWYTDNLKISIPVTVAIGAGILIVLVVTICLCRWCIKRHAVKSKGYVRIQYGQGASNTLYHHTPDNDAAVTKSGGLATGKEPGVGEAMNFEKKQIEKTERETAEWAVKFYLRSNTRYKWVMRLPDMGSRLKKFWFLVSVHEGPDLSGPKQMLLTIAPVPKQCAIKLPNSEHTLNELYANLKHPFVHHIREVKYLQDRNSLITIQPYLPKGTLKDYIYRSKPDIDWSGKYSRRSRGLRSDRVALFGRQILEALVFLYKKGFPPLGHIQSGNVFVEGEVCRLGGYDTMLLGYKTRLYNKIKEQGALESIDTVMFGHLVFEMACGYELIPLAPSNEDYNAVKDSDIHEVLVFIFSDSPNSFPTIEWVLEQSFFQRPMVPQLQEWDSNTVHLSSEVEAMLRTVVKGKSPHHHHHHSDTAKPVPLPRTRNHQTITGTVSGQPPVVSVTPVAEQRNPPIPLERQDLLTDIRTGTPLRNTETDDRSSPRI